MERADNLKDTVIEERLLMIVCVYRHFRRNIHLEVQLAWVILTPREVWSFKIRETEKTKSDVLR